MIQKFEINESTFNGYLSLPISGKGNGLLLFHGWWGLNDFILQTCDRLAQAGFVALAPDYYRGKTAETIERAKALKKNFDRKSTNKLVALAADFLVSQSALSSPRIGSLGFSLGASFAIEAARRTSQFVNAVVLFYGTGGGKFDKTGAAFMGHFTENDDWGVHPKKINALADRIRAANQEAKFYTYPNTEHWFVETDRPEYDQTASELAWQRTIEFLQDQLA